MSDAHRASAATPLSIRLSIPVDGAFRVLGMALAARFATTAGATADDADRLGERFGRACEDVVARAGADDQASLDVEFSRTGDGQIEIRLRCAGGEPDVIRTSPSR